MPKNKKQKELKMQDLDFDQLKCRKVIILNKLGLSCAKLRASFDLFGFDSLLAHNYQRLDLLIDLILKLGICCSLRFGLVGLIC